MHVALLFNGRPAAPPEGQPDDLYEEYDSDATVQAIAAPLRALGHTLTPVQADGQLVERLRAGGFDLAFNVAEGELRWGRSREAIPAAACALVGLPCTHSDVLTLAVTLDKAAARRLVSPEVPVARGVLLTIGESPQEGRAAEALAALTYPVLVKPNDEGSSKGVRGGPIADELAGAVERVERLRADYGCDVIVEEYLPGVEVTVGVAGNGAQARVIGAMEISPAEPGERWVYSLEVKRDWRRRVRYHTPPRLPEATLALVEERALLAYRLLGCRDLARIDLRLDAEGSPRFIECNPLPGLNPESGDVVLLSRGSLSYDALIQGVLSDALSRQAPR